MKQRKTKRKKTTNQKVKNATPNIYDGIEFKSKLEKNGINVTIRRERGSDIDGACGQLRRRHAAKSEGETDENLCND